MHSGDERGVGHAGRSQGSGGVCAAGLDDMAPAAGKCALGDGRQTASDSGTGDVCLNATTRNGSSWAPTLSQERERMGHGTCARRIAAAWRLPLCATRSPHRGLSHREQPGESRSAGWNRCAVGAHRRAALRRPGDARRKLSFHARAGRKLGAARPAHSRSSICAVACISATAVR